MIVTVTTYITHQHAVLDVVPLLEAEVTEVPLGGRPPPQGLLQQRLLGRGAQTKFIELVQELIVYVGTGEGAAPHGVEGPGVRELVRRACRERQLREWGQHTGQVVETEGVAGRLVEKRAGQRWTQLGYVVHQVGGAGVHAFLSNNARGGLGVPHQLVRGVQLRERARRGGGSGLLRTLNIKHKVLSQLVTGKCLRVQLVFGSDRVPFIPRHHMVHVIVTQLVSHHSVWAGAGLTLARKNVVEDSVVYFVLRLDVREIVGRGTHGGWFLEERFMCYLKATQLVVLVIILRKGM